jgi:8-oxo-dGTP diphosphatase
MPKEMKFAVKGVVVRDDGRVLIIKKGPNENVNPNTFDIPGGGMELGETPQESLHREIKEETGLEVKIIKPTRTWSFTKGDIQVVGITFLCKHISGEVCLSHEHTEYEWVDPKEASSKGFEKWLLEEISAAVV